MLLKNEFIPKEPKNIEFELKEDESESTTKQDSEEEEPQNPAVRRSDRKEDNQKGIVHLIFVQIFP